MYLLTNNGQEWSPFPHSPLIYLKFPNVMLYFEFLNLLNFNAQISLPELGMDSITGTEIQKVLKKDFEVSLTPTDLRTLTFAK